MFLHYFRTTDDGRVLMGSGSGPIGHGGRVDDGASSPTPPRPAVPSSGCASSCPALADAKVTHAWGGPIDVSADHLPFFGTVPGARIHYGVGYSGSGVGASWLGGQILASLVTAPLGRVDGLGARPSRRVPALPPEPFRRLGGGARPRRDPRLRGARGGRPPRAAVARAGAGFPALTGMRGRQR